MTLVYTSEHTIQMASEPTADAAFESALNGINAGVKLGNDIATKQGSLAVLQDAEEIAVELRPCCLYIFFCCLRGRKVSPPGSSGSSMALSRSVSSQPPSHCSTCGGSTGSSQPSPVGASVATLASSAGAFSAATKVVLDSTKITG